MTQELIERLRAICDPNGLADEAADALQSQSARIAERDRVIGIAADALDVADNIIAVNMGTDTPKEWDRAFKRVAKARASLTKDSTSG